MEWSDIGIVLGVRRHGETSVILDALTRQHGRHPGFVHGGRSRRLRPCLQPGNGVDLAWRSRLDEQLGTYQVEPRRLRAARIMEAAAPLQATNHLCGLMRLLAEREPHVLLFDHLEAILDGITDPVATPPEIVRFELDVLSDLGFGLDLTRCAATGTRDDLCFVSPKSGRAVSRDAGAPYADRLLPLPPFLLSDGEPRDRAELADGLRLSGFFLERDLFAARGLPVPEARAAYIRAITPPGEA